MDITIRAAAAGDAPEVAELLHASWHRTYDSLMGEARVAETSARIHDPAKLLHEFADPAIITRVAVAPRHLRGVIKADRRPQAELHVDRLHVVPEAFGSGLADRLLDAALGGMPEARTITLDVLAGNHRAIAYYLKRGFAVERTLDACAGVLGVPTLIMRKTLPF